MGERSEFGLLGFGHAHASVGAYLASRGLAATTWALPHHSENGHHSNGHHTNGHHTSGHHTNGHHTNGNQSSGHHANGNPVNVNHENGNHANGHHNAHHGNVPNNAQPLKEAASLQDMVAWHKCLILATPADAQESYFVALEELNPLLQDTTLVVVDGSDSTPLSSGRLHTKHVIESHLFRPAPKLARDKPALNGTGVSQKYESCCSKLSNGNSNNSTPSLSASVRSLLNDLTRLSAKVSQRGMSLEDGLGELLRYKDGLVESFAHVAEYENKDTPVVTMFSGGLDSTYLLLKLQQLGFTNVHAVAVDVGGFIDEDQLTKFAAHFGATFICLDGRELFVQQGVTPAIRAHAKYLGMYPISSSLSRPVIARLTADYAKSLNAGLLLHTANLSQNSLPRLNNSLRHYGFSGKFGSPYVRSVVSRKQKALELSAVGLTFKSDRKLSGDENLWCREFETGPLDDPETFDIPEDAYEWTAHSGHYAPEKLKLTFERGNLVAVNGDRLALAEAIALLNREVGKFGHGRFVGLEAIRTDEKVLEVREAPAATIIMDALRHLEVASLESNALELKQSLEQKWVAEAIAGRWESSCHSMCDAAIASAVDRVGGSVTYRIDHMRYLPCSIVADNARYIRDRDQWEYKESLRPTFRS